MPRVAKSSRASGRGAATATPHEKNTPKRIPLNDDKGEKAARLQSRQALHDIQMNQLKAAATPRRYNSMTRSNVNSPQNITPTTGGPRGKENEFEGGLNVSGTSVTPMKRVPLLANFEEWMKMATDNKINATNSWNFALIDYFHDMSLLKEGDGVNFQKASCTLDGCVKIYTSRVDSVATETGKLLSGLADSGNKRRKDDDQEDEDGEDGEEDENGERKKSRKKTSRSHESTLAPNFNSLQLKKFELEFSVDPLFKKASADFDEGGAKGLLLNHLAIDATGRIVFDSSDDAGDITAEETRRRREDGEDALDDADEDAKTPTPEPETEEVEEPAVAIDLGSLASRFFPDLELLDEQDICPSLKNLDLGDPNGSLDIPFLKAPDDWREKTEAPEDTVGDRSGIMLDDGAAGFDDDDDGLLGGFDLPADTGFGEGGEVWAKEAALEPMLKPSRIDGGQEDLDGDEEGGDLDPSSDDPYAVRLQHGNSAQYAHENILSYFDNALQKNWTGPEHWRIRKIKQTINPEGNAPTRQRKEKEPFEINFASELDPALAELIYTPAASSTSISLPKNQRKTKTRNLLPDDKHFNSGQLLKLFLKPKARMGHTRKSGFNKTSTHQAPETGAAPAEMDEAFWAKHQQTNPTDTNPAGSETPAPKGDYDADFFADDDGLPFLGGGFLSDDDDELPFADAREAFSPQPGADPNDPNALAAAAETAAATGQPASVIANILAGVTSSSQPTNLGFGSNLVTQGGRRTRPEYVNYARVAKKVDVRRLKENMWKGLEGLLPPLPDVPLSVASQEQNTEDTPSDAMITDSNPAVDEHGIPLPSGSISALGLSKDNNEDLRFTSMMNDLTSVYPASSMKDISTSFCFICLLHLANEKGLVLKGQEESEGMGEIFVKRDPGVSVGYEGE